MQLDRQQLCRRLIIAVGTMVAVSLPLRSGACLRRLGLQAFAFYI